MVRPLERIQSFIIPCALAAFASTESILMLQEKSVIMSRYFYVTCL